jgi:LacI family transcriptional regulator
MRIGPEQGRGAARSVHAAHPTDEVGHPYTGTRRLGSALYASAVASDERETLTSRGIAELSGVSQTTVSRVLAGHPNVRPATRERVLRVLAETGYSPNATAQAMRRRRTGVVGIVVGRVTNPFYPQLAEGLHQEISRRHLQMSMWISDGGAEDSGELAALDAVRRRAIDGVVYTTVTSDSPSLAEALRQAAPIVLLNRTLRGVAVDSVSSDNPRGAAAVASHFLALGHSRLGIVSGLPNVSTTYEREQGFVDALHEHVRDGTVTVQTVRGDFTHAAGQRALAQMLDGGEPPTAIFCVNDVVAFGVIDEARRRGVQVPRALSVAGYDDTDIAAWAAYDLTTVRQPVDDMARRGVDLLLERIAGDRGGPTRAERLVGELVIRSSTAPPAG